jgi:hypothetical protein
VVPREAAMVVALVSAGLTDRPVQTGGATAAKWEETEVALGLMALEGFPERMDSVVATAVKAASLVRGRQKTAAN